jgi:hypothetical protein
MASAYDHAISSSVHYIIVKKDGEVFPLINSLSSQSLLTVELIIATISPRRFLGALLATEVLDSIVWQVLDDINTETADYQQIHKDVLP